MYKDWLRTIHRVLLCNCMREAAPSLFWCALFLAARYPIRLAAVYGVSAQKIQIAEDAQFAGLVIAIGSVLLASGIALLPGQRRTLPAKTYRLAIFLAETWAMLSLAVRESAPARAIGGALLILVLCLGVDLFRRSASWRNRCSRDPVQRDGARPAAALALVLILTAPSGAFERTLSGYRLDRLLRDAGRDHSSVAVRDWISAATLNRVLFDRAVLANAGRRLLARGRQDPVDTDHALPQQEIDDAWEAAISIVNARWALAEFTAPESTPVPVESQFSVWGTLRVDMIPVADGTRHSNAQIESAIVTHARGPGAIVLDGLRIRRVVFDRVPLAYNGGPLDLEGVELPHCSLYVARCEAGRRFLEAALAEGPVEFHSQP